MSCQKAERGGKGEGLLNVLHNNSTPNLLHKQNQWLKWPNMTLIPGMAPTNFNEQFVDLCQKPGSPRAATARWFYSHNKLLIFKIKYLELLAPQTFLSWNETLACQIQDESDPKVKHKLYVLWSTDLWYISAKINANYFLLIFGCCFSLCFFGKIPVHGDSH